MRNSVTMGRMCKKFGYHGKKLPLFLIKKLNWLTWHDNMVLTWTGSISSQMYVIICREKMGRSGWEWE